MSFIRQVIDVILPGSCVICGKLGVPHKELPFNMPEDLDLCHECMARLVPVPKDRRWLILLSEPYDGDPYPGLTLYMPFPYDDFFGKAIPTIKFKRNINLARFLGRLLGSLIYKDEICVDAIVPVPLSEERLNERGFNQAEVIGEECAKILGVPLLRNSLTRTRNTKRQTGLVSNSERSSNVEGAFKVVSDSDIKGKTVIIIDDVATTGHTLHEAACELLYGGASKVLCMALCGNRTVKNADSF